MWQIVRKRFSQEITFTKIPVGNGSQHREQQAQVLVPVEGKNGGQIDAY